MGLEAETEWKLKVKTELEIAPSRRTGKYRYRLAANGLGDEVVLFRVRCHRQPAERIGMHAVQAALAFGFSRCGGYA